MVHTPTAEQTAYYTASADPRGGNTALKALAGTGKTTTLTGLAAKLPGSGLATSVLKSTTADLAKAMPANFDTLGMHALGYRAIRKKLPSAKVDSKGNVLYEFLKERLKNEDNQWKLFAEIKPLVEQAMLAGIVPNCDKFITADHPDNWEILAERFDIDWSPIIYSAAHAALIHLNQQALKGTIQFTHMLTLPLFFGFPVTQYPKVLVDEAQDLNPLQHGIIERALRHNGRLFLVGDPSQAIMAFSGADSNSFYSLTAKFNCKILPLTVSWRCPRAVIAVAQQYVPTIQAAPNAIEGTVVEAEPTDLDDLPRNILCRNNAPLLRLAMRLFVAGYSVECAGRDIGAGLKSTIKRIASGKNSDGMKSSDFTIRLHRWAEREIARRPARRHAVSDKLDALLALAEHHQTVGSMRKHIDHLYVNTEGDAQQLAEFQLSTIHKAKGREWDRVGFLDAHLIPAKWAKQPWEQEQESNLSYVAVTRAKQELVYLDSKLIQ